MFAMMLTPVNALALPKAGDGRPALVLTDAWDRSLSVPVQTGKPLLLVYEDKDSATQNAAFKDELAQLAKGDRYKDSVGLLAVADVTGYDYWPVSGFVKDAIKSESQKAKTTIYCDWNGAVRRATGVRAGKSTVILYAPNGKVLLSYEGPMSKEDRAALFSALRSLVPDKSA
jgi:hypothetical protein